MSEDPVVQALREAVEASPEVVALRLQLARTLLDRGRAAEALPQCTAVLARQPGSPDALALIEQASAALGSPAPRHTGFDWAAAEDQVADLIEPAYTADTGAGPGDDEVEQPTVRLADVGGMTEVKERLELALLGPMRNPDLAAAFGTSARGGLLLYGPPGCGKTFIARAVAGELGARFYSIGIADVLDMYVGSSERNLREVFQVARRNAPCVLFFDEVDALGQKRSQLRHSAAMRSTVNQLLAEMDSMNADNDGVFVLGATNQPWDVDPALRRPGRFDRMLLVLPPDPPARTAIVRYHLRDRPLAGIDLGAIVSATEGFSGADLAHVCRTATDYAMADSLRTGQVRPVGMDDVRTALREVRPSTGPWFDTARSVVTFANADGTYDDLVRHLKRRR